MNEAIKEVVAQNLILGIVLIALVPLIKIAPSLLTTLREWKSLRTLLKEMAEAQEASDKFADAGNRGLKSSSQEYLKVILYPKFRRKIESKVDREIKNLMPRRYRMSPHSLIVVAITAIFTATYFIVASVMTILVALSGQENLSLAVTPTASMIGTLAVLLIGNKFESRIIPDRYNPKYFTHRIKALNKFNEEHGLNSPLLVRNGPRFDRYTKRANGKYVLVNERARASG